MAKVASHLSSSISLSPSERFTSPQCRSPHSCSPSPFPENSACHSSKFPTARTTFCSSYVQYVPTRTEASTASLSQSKAGRTLLKSQSARAFEKGALREGRCRKFRRRDFPVGVVRAADFDGFDASEVFEANKKGPKPEDNGEMLTGVDSLPKLAADIDEITDEMREMQPTGTKDVDIRYMRRAIRLAVMARGFTSPNPMVGCVVVRNGMVVGEGWHPKAGEPHAEVFALAEAQSQAQGATAYVTLEPCNHFGRTPPCTEALIRAKVKKVVIGTVDRNPLVGGKGIERLREAGIEVLVGVEYAACTELNIPFFFRSLHKKPYQMLRYALSMNGKSHAEMVDNATREHLHMFLADYDATVISWKSLPLSGWDLQCMIAGTNQSVRVVVGKSFGATDNLQWLTDEVANHPAWKTENAPMILALWHDLSSPQLQRLESMGVEVRRYAPEVPVQDAIVPLLYDKGCCSIVWLGNPCDEVIDVQQIYAYAVPYYNLEGGLPAPKFTYTNAVASQNHKDGWHYLGNTQLFLTPSSACLRASASGMLEDT